MLSMRESRSCHVNYKQQRESILVELLYNGIIDVNCMHKYNEILKAYYEHAIMSLEGETYYLYKIAYSALFFTLLSRMYKLKSPPRLKNSTCGKSCSNMADKESKSSALD